MDAIHRTYLYNAHGHALSGQILRPFQETIEVQAGMSLPTTGGYGSARVENFRLKQVISFKSASTQVSGSFNERDKSHTTLVSTTVEGLNILDVVTADKVVARLASRHPVNDGEPHIVLLGSHFVNLRIAGCPTTVELDHDLFLKLDTFAAFRKELESNTDFRRMALDPYRTGKAQETPPVHGVVLCSLVKEIKTACPGVEHRGHEIVVPEFGRIFVAEVIAEHSRRTLTMLRLELGSPTSGPITVAEAQGNGKPYPPTPGGGTS
jgi:hypothetical protein